MELGSKYASHRHSRSTKGEDVDVNRIIQATKMEKVLEAQVHNNVQRNQLTSEN